MRALRSRKEEFRATTIGQMTKLDMKGFSQYKDKKGLSNYEGFVNL